MKVAEKAHIQTAASFLKVGITAGMALFLSLARSVDHLKKIDFGFNPVAKPNYKRSKPTAKERGKFSSETILNIHIRDNGKCVCCGSGRVEAVPHHVIFRSQGGTGTEDNGVLVCSPCHLWAHGRADGPNGEPFNEGRKWFENYREENLL
ncbi:HNH endonuclease [Bacillus phage Pavlov]|uniref:HNH endonuclease n=1 Tax=Bacillus phage Pavlov TaxID=1675598 RepID=UPI00065F3D0E|nr:HNH endonuclease [Bacillus phage Pavlov]AKQ07467.1 HNH homing endonuclease [Bacillus phage Pavlov]